MDLTLSVEDEAFRQEVRAFIAAELTEELREAGRRCAAIYNDYGPANGWHRILARKGWSVPEWPVEHGGTGWTPMQHYVFQREMADADTPEITPNSTHMIAPAIMAYGTAEQKSLFLPRIASGEDWWAQGYSEPGSGSDLASLRCAAVRDGDQYIVNGSKIWTTHAHFSNRIFCLVRTRVEDKPQRGITFLLLDLDLPGISIRPIISISGDHELNEVFFDNVRVPASGLLGQENDGWTVAKYLLQHERSHNWSPRLWQRLRRMKDRAVLPRDGDGRPLIDNPLLAARLAEAEIRLSALEIAELRILSGNDETQHSAATPSMMKILGTELKQTLTQIAIEIEGADATVLPHDDRAPSRFRPGMDSIRAYLNDRAASIYAGTNEVQRNIMASALLR